MSPYLLVEGRHAVAEPPRVVDAGRLLGEPSQLPEAPGGGRHGAHLIVVQRELDVSWTHEQTTVGTGHLVSAGGNGGKT